MKMMVASVFVLVAASFSLNAAPTRLYQNVPSITIQSDTFKTSDGRSVSEAARQQCENEVKQSTRLLNQKGVDIILETTPCTLVETLEDAAHFSATLYFLN